MSKYILDMKGASWLRFLSPPLYVCCNLFLRIVLFVPYFLPFLFVFFNHYFPLFLIISVFSQQIDEIK